MNPVIVKQGKSPLILAFPHGGVYVPDDILVKLNDNGQLLADTDWHIHQLYDGLLENVTTVQATFHRYVIDANRDPKGGSLYPGQNTTGLVSDTDFDGLAIWQEGQTPDQAEVERRRLAWHTPYHEALSQQIERVKTEHGCAVVYDCHSIRPNIPYLFEGTLPDFNIGSNDTTSCHKSIEQSVLQDCAAATDYTHVLNGRFKGGWTTRHYGDPDNAVHLIQMELAQSAYASNDYPWGYNRQQADKLRPVLKTILTHLEALALDRLI